MPKSAAAPDVDGAAVAATCRRLLERSRRCDVEVCPVDGGTALAAEVAWCVVESCVGAPYCFNFTLNVGGDNHCAATTGWIAPAGLCVAEAIGSGAWRCLPEGRTAIRGPRPGC
jgi:hypothetical protein